MDKNQAELLKASLESFMNCLEVPMLLGSVIGDPVFKKSNRILKRRCRFESRL
jgi:hypothetical protein